MYLDAIMTTSSTFYTRSCLNVTGTKKAEQKCQQHLVFPSGHPSKY